MTFTDEELKALDQQASRGIEIAEFVPEDSLEPMSLAARGTRPVPGKTKRRGRSRAAGERKAS